VRDGVLYLKPTLTADRIGEGPMTNNYDLNLWGGAPADICTSNAFYGCERVAGAGGNYLNPIKSARLRTVKSYNVKYGKVEVRARIPKGDWLWPAIWMLPKANYYGEWPASGEIDLMEARCNTPTGNPAYPGVDWVGSALHYGPHFPENGFHLTTESLQMQSGTFADDFHIYSLEWNEFEIHVLVDGQSLTRIDLTETSFWEKGGWNSSNYDNPWSGRPNIAPFDQPFYVILNVAVGGTAYFADGWPGKPWRNDSPNAVNEFYNAKDAWMPTWQMNDPSHPSAMKVDYVRIYCDESIQGSCDGHKLLD